MSSFKFDTQEPRSMRHIVAQEIRKAIFDGSLKPGDRLREQDISNQMKISRGPIREALTLLEREGLVVTYPYKETVVAEFQIDELTEVLLPIRLTLEAFALKRTLKNLTEDDIQSLEDMVQTMTVSAEARDLSALVTQDVNFHRFFIKKSELSTVLSLWETIDMRIRLHFSIHGQEYVDLHEIPKEHHELLEVYKTGNIRQALSALRHHIVELNVIEVEQSE